MEYLQCKLLEIIFNSRLAPKLAFLGGTSLRIIYGNSRFSEDLDFDNFGLTETEFTELAGIIQKGLEHEGLTVEVGVSSRQALRCDIRLPGLLFANELSGHLEEKILIHVDSVAQHFDYLPDKKILNKFDVFSDVFVTPPDIILSQKIYAATNRNRAKGRDFYDIVFLASFVKPNYAYLKTKLGVADSGALRARLETELQRLDFKALGKDVQPFLFNPADIRRVELFPEFIKQLG